MIKIISCFWNASKYIEESINSVKNQAFKDFKIYLIDDVSTDDTVEKIKPLIEDDDRFCLIKNKDKKFKLKNIDDLIRNESEIDDEDIIVELDGDDQFANNNVLIIINNKYYNNPNLWLTNGSFIYKDGRIGFSNKVDYSQIRKQPFQFSHLRTWKAHLWKRINAEDFNHKFGNPIISAPDLAYSFPMIEMAGNIHYEFIPEILYIYNDESPYNEFKDESAGGGKFQQFLCESEIRSKKPYEPI